MAETEVSSADYNSVRALVQGEIDTFMGFNFIRIERLDVDASGDSFDTTAGTVGSGGGTLSSSYRQCIFWAMDGLLLAVGQDMKARVSERSDKSYSMQAYASMSIGATRMEEAKVVNVFALES